MPIIDEFPTPFHHHYRLSEDALEFTLEAKTANGWKPAKYRIVQALGARIKWLWRQRDEAVAAEREEIAKWIENFERIEAPDLLAAQIRAGCHRDP